MIYDVRTVTHVSNGQARNSSVLRSASVYGQPHGWKVEANIAVVSGLTAAAIVHNVP